MPELPEVEKFRSIINETSINKEIGDIYYRDDYVLKNPKKKFKDALINRKIDSTIRHGKYLFLKINSNHLLFHFGMSGSIEYFTEKDEEPEYSKVIFKFLSDGFLSYISIRKFGKVQIIEDLSSYIKEIDLGPDALKVSFEDFKKIMNRKRRSYAKTALMDQSAVSGIGNLYSDEILFQAHIYPKRKISDLEDSEISKLFKIMKDVLRDVISYKKELEGYPKNYIVPHRSKEDKCPICNSQIEKLKISSRHGYYCPKCQK
ncbi:MAG: hypothetical protein GF317_07400 [Candidatus Lokiarchaeota archaeon]|nr:hypothetical protein [Candidatus Lokiarchaeota archaeon]MBD3199534.1 hypothetical protein [Candidatus Lokiarchaeota archaeon]